MDNLSYLFQEQEVYNLAEIMSKSGNKRLITDIAISKIPYVAYPDCDAQQSLILHELGEHLLKLSKQKNNSDEISVTINIKENNKIIDGMDKILQKVGLCYGTKDETLLFSDPLTMHLVRGATDIAVVNLHNHPSCSPHSTLDLSFFLRESAVKMMIILGNNGELYYLSKTEKYNHDLARRYLTQAAYVVKPNVKETDKFTAMELRQVADLFLKNCYQFGIEYNHVLGTNRFLEETKNKILNNNIEEEDIDYDR